MVGVARLYAPLAADAGDRRGRRRPRRRGRGRGRALRRRADDHATPAIAAALAAPCSTASCRPMSRLEIIPIEGIPEVRPGDDLAGLIADAAEPGTSLRDGDVRGRHPEGRVEGRGRAWSRSTPTTRCGHKADRRGASRCGSLRRRGDLIISETKHGFVCANAGVDLSNVDEGWAALLPVDSDRSARRIRDGLRARAGVEVAVIVSDTFGRPWRRGLTDVAIGCAGIARGRRPAGHRGQPRAASSRSPRWRWSTSWPPPPSW